MLAEICTFPWDLKSTKQTIGSMQWNINPTKMSSNFSEQCGTFFQFWRQIPLQWKMWYFFSVIEIEYSTPLITVFSETSTQQKRLPTTVNNVVIFFSYGDKLVNTFNYCMQWNLNQTTTKLPRRWTMWYFFSVLDTDPTSVNNVVLFPSYGYRLLNLFN